MTTTPTSDPLAALAAELGRIGRRLDGMGVELLTLREAESEVAAEAATAAPSPTEGQAVGLPVPGAAAPSGAPGSWGGAGAVAASAGGAVAGPPHGAAMAEPGHGGSAHGDSGAPGGPWGGPGPDQWAGGGTPLPVPAGAPYPSYSAYQWAGGGTPFPEPAGAPYPSYSAYPSASAGPLAPPSPAGRVPVPGWSAPGRAPAGPPPVDPPPMAWGAPTAAPAPKRSPLTGARLLAWTGGAVTLFGVVLLLALAASRGWFTPPARVAFGAVLGAGLVGLGVWLHRRESARAGALALVATGFATLYLVDAAAAAVFGYLPPVPALLLALGIAGAGLGLADRWRTPLLAGGVVVGAAVLAPALADGWLLVALVLMLQLAALLVVLRRRWAGLMLPAAAGPVLYGMYAVGAEEGVFAVVGVAAAVLVVALATATLALRPTRGAGTPGDGPGAQTAGIPHGGPAPSASVTSARMSGAVSGAEDGSAIGTSARTWVGAVAAVVATAVLPALVGAPTVGGWGGALVAGGAAVALAVLALLPTGPRAVKVAAGVAAVTALLTATVVGLDGSPAVLAVLGEAVVAALLAVGLRSRFAMITALVLGGLGWIAAIQWDAPIATLVEFAIAPTVPELVTAIAAGALILALAAALLVAGGRLGWIRPDASRAAIWVPIGLIGLYGAAGIVVNAALLVAPTSTGFTAGHAIVTVSWTVGALVLLAHGLRRPALRFAGLVLVAAAVAKLVLFDLVALDGLARVAAFLGAGLVLLAAGTRYARLVAEAEKAPPSE